MLRKFNYSFILGSAVFQQVDSIIVSVGTKLNFVRQWREVNCQNVAFTFLCNITNDLNESTILLGVK